MASNSAAYWFQLKSELMAVLAEGNKTPTSSWHAAKCAWSDNIVNYINCLFLCTSAEEGRTSPINQSPYPLNVPADIAVKSKSTKADHTFISWKFRIEILLQSIRWAFSPAPFCRPFEIGNVCCRITQGVNYDSSAIHLQFKVSNRIKTDDIHRNFLIQFDLLNESQPSGKTRATPSVASMIFVGLRQMPNWKLKT